MSDTPVYIKREDALLFFKSKKNEGFDVLMDLFAIDYLHWEEKAERFEIVYNLYSTTKRQRLFVKVSVPERDLDKRAAIYRTLVG